MSDIDAGILRLADEAEQTLRVSVREVQRDTLEVDGIMPRPADAGSVAMIRRNVEDAAHLHDELLNELLALLDGPDAGCEAHGGSMCTLDEMENNRACYICQSVYKLKCAGAEIIHE